MNKLILTTFIYFILIGFLGFLISNYLMKTVIREGARTLPRPVINPEVKQPDKYYPAPPYTGETLNQMIDRMIYRWFDKKGYPYYNTIELYETKCINKGNVTIENKKKMTDIGYYLLNIVIPNIQTTSNPNPEQNWPPIKWSDANIFPILKQPTPTYDLYKGLDYDLDGIRYGGDSNSGNDGSDGSSGQSFGNNNSGSIDGLDGNQAQTDVNAGDIPGYCDSMTGKQGKTTFDCGIGCPKSCLDGVAAAWYKADELEKELNNARDGVSGDSFDYGSLYDDFSNFFGFGEADSDGTNPLTAIRLSKNNSLIIGDVEYDGYSITDAKQTGTGSELNSSIEEQIDYYFIKSGPNKNRPTKEAIALFDTYFKNKTPMDGIHMNKLRDVVYYMLQVIIPGLPTADRPRSYVEWRPIVWISLSQPK